MGKISEEKTKNPSVKISPPPQCNQGRGLILSQIAAAVRFFNGRFVLKWPPKSSAAIKKPKLCLFLPILSVLDRRGISLFETTAIHINCCSAIAIKGGILRNTVAAAWPLIKFFNCSCGCCQPLLGKAFPRFLASMFTAPNVWL